MKYLSLCSGIEAATVAFHPLGWEPVAFTEIEPFPSSVLRHHYPDVPNWGDITKFKEWPYVAVDVVVGGPPCQAFSVAGLRAGMADPRGNLTLTYCAILEKYRPRWFVYENVPGLLSVSRGRDFGAFLGALEKLGYGWAYRTLDAQYVRVESHRRAVPQRRRRVFVVGYLGDWRRAAAVLFERESLSGNPAPSRKAGEKVAPTVTSGAPFSRTGNERVEAEAMVVQPFQVAPYAIRCAQTGSNGWGINDEVAYTLDQASPQAICMATGQASAEIGIGIGTTLNCNHEAPIVLMDQGGGVMKVFTDMAVRRLTPVECERLQGFPDGYTNIPWRKKPEAPDTPRYKALGNSMAVNVMRWIGERIELIAAKKS